MVAETRGCGARRGDLRCRRVAGVKVVLAEGECGRTRTIRAVGRLVVANVGGVVAWELGTGRSRRGAGRSGP